MAKWKWLEQNVHQELQKEGVRLRGRKILLSLSGGADSTALFRVINSLQEPLHFEWGAIHFHHGGSSDFRKQAQGFCEELCVKHKISLQVVQSDVELKSEEKMREFRRLHLFRFLKQSPQNLVVFGHHRQDLLETRMLRLIRGTGTQGLVSMSYFANQVWRPFLHFDKENLIEYLRNLEQKFVEDPSNRQVAYFRNWLRHEWLPQLERRQAGASESLLTSLENISQSSNTDLYPELWINKSEVRWPYFLALSRWDQRKTLAQMLLNSGTRDFSRGQLEEIQKQLDTCAKVHKFDLADVTWSLNAERLMVKRRVG